MRTIRLDRQAPQGERGPRLSRLVRHLKARLEDFGPGGPQVLGEEQGQGWVSFRVPGQDTGRVVRGLERECGVALALEGDRAVCYLRGDTRFEDLDYLWGCLFGLLS